MDNSWFIDLDMFGKDISTVTLNDVKTIEKTEGYYGVVVNGLKIDFDMPIL